MKLTLKKSGWIVPMIIGVLLPLVDKASANDTTFFRTVFSTDMAVAGVGGMRNVGSGVITMAEVSGSVRRAYLY